MAGTRGGEKGTDPVTMTGLQGVLRRSLVGRNSYTGVISVHDNRHVVEQADRLSGRRAGHSAP